MKKGSFRIQVPEPCSENWQSMTVADDLRRHCAACDTTVIDFSQMSDDELIIYMSQAKGKVCGRLASTQINRSFRPVAPPKFSPRWWKSLLLLPLSFYAHQVSAQSRAPMQKVPRSLLFDKGNDVKSQKTDSTERTFEVTDIDTSYAMDVNAETVINDTASADTTKPFTLEWKNLHVDSAYYPEQIIGVYNVEVSVVTGAMVMVYDSQAEASLNCPYKVEIIEGGITSNSPFIHAEVSSVFIVDNDTVFTKPLLPLPSIRNSISTENSVKEKTEQHPSKKEQTDNEQAAILPAQNDSRKKRK